LATTSELDQLEMANTMLHKLIVAAAWACLAFIVFATLSSIQMRPEIAGGRFAAVERFGAYAAFGLLLVLAYPRHLAFACIVVLGSAIVLELLQHFAPGRHGRLLDAIEKLLGGGAGLLLARILQSGLWRKPLIASGPPRPN
jgi:VanZ family protein